MLRSRKRRLPPLPEDDGMVKFRHLLVTPDVAQRTAQLIMAGFDELPPHHRAEINYAPWGSQQTRRFKFTRGVHKAQGKALLDELGL